MINNVTLVGRLTKDPELRYTGQNTAVATFTIAVSRRFKNAAGEREADFITCVIWRQFAENLAKWAKKGNLIGVTGSIQTRNYENQQGQRVYVTEVLAENFQMLESRANRETGLSRSDYPEEQSFQSPARSVEDSKPSFARDTDPFSSGQPMEISDDDLPF